MRVKDVARVELGSQDYSWITRLNGQPSAIVGIYQLPGSNAVEAAKGIRKLMAKMKESFPADVDYAVTLDTTDAVRAGMHEIVQTLVIAFVLVILVVYIFLQDWRATIYSRCSRCLSRWSATFAVFPLFGFSVNTLSLFGLGAGDRPGGGRRHRRGRRHTTPHRRRSDSEGCGSQGHAGTDRAGGWYRTGTLRGVRADRIHPRHHRPTLSAICVDHRNFRRLFQPSTP